MDKQQAADNIRSAVAEHRLTKYQFQRKTGQCCLIGAIDRKIGCFADAYRIAPMPAWAIDLFARINDLVEDQEAFALRAADALPTLPEEPEMRALLLKRAEEMYPDELTRNVGLIGNLFAEIRYGNPTGFAVYAFNAMYDLKGADAAIAFIMT